MKAFIVALVVLASTAAMAQRAVREPEPAPIVNKTVRLIDNKTKEVVGTVVVSGRWMYLRNKQGVHYATIETNEDGTRTAYDPKGERIDMSTMPGLE